MGNVSVADIFVGEATVQMPWNGKEISITYNPNEYTPDIEAEWAKMEVRGWMGPVLTDFVVKLVKRWTLTGDWVPEDEKDWSKGGKFIDTKEPFPIETAKVSKLPAMFLGQVMEAVTEDSRLEGRS